MAQNNTFQVRSQNFDFHQPVVAASFAAAVEVAKARGFEAIIEKLERASFYQYDLGMKPVLVASWSPLYGLKFHRDDIIRADLMRNGGAS